MTQELTSTRAQPLVALPTPRLILGLVATLHPPTPKTGIAYTGRYSVSFQGETIIEGSHDPELDAARVLVARGYRGRLTFLDAETGQRRLIINDLVKAARLTVKEGPLRLAAYQSRPDRSPAGETGEPRVMNPSPRRNAV